MDILYPALESVFQWQVLVVIVAAALYGIFVGSIPGLTATMAIALMVPITFYLSDVQAIAAIVTTVTCSIFAGDIPATLLRIPGTPASAAYASDAYALTQQGRHTQALCVALMFSVVGGLLGTAVLAGAAPQLARFATSFTSFEYFWLYLLGLSCAVVVSNGGVAKSLFALSIGLLLSTVGLGADFSVPRLTFGYNELITGIGFIPAMIGLFGISEVLRVARQIHWPSDSVSGEAGAKTPQPEQDLPSGQTRAGLIAGVLPLLWLRKWHLVRSSSVGAIVGMLPGAGADIAAWISYALSRRFSKSPERYGHGSIEGLSDATGANNAALGGAWIPALVFGIPGDSVTAIALGVLMMKNITPGPAIFDSTENPEQAVLVGCVVVTFVLANLILLPIGRLAIGAASLLIRVPRATLLPVIVVFCIVGSYSISASYLDVWIMLALGLLGFVLERYRVPLAPIVLGLLLGGPLEHRFIQCITTSSSIGSFFGSSISIVLAIVCASVWLSTFTRRRSLVAAEVRRLES